MKQSGAWVSILALFGVGILIGGLATHLLYATGHLGEADEPRRSSGRGGAEPRERIPLRGADSLESLDLTDEQRQALRKIIEETRVEGREMRESWRPQIQSLMQNAQERISELLTEEQRSRWASLREQQPLVLERMFLGGAADLIDHAADVAALAGIVRGARPRGLDLDVVPEAAHLQLALRQKDLLLVAGFRHTEREAIRGDSGVPTRSSENCCLGKR